MSTLSSKLVVSLVDNLSGRAKRIAASLHEMRGAAGGAAASVGRTAGEVTRATRGFASAGVGSAATSAVGALFVRNEYAFDRQAKFIEATTSASAEAMSALTSEMIRLAEKYPLTRSEIAEGAKEFVTAGNSIETTTAALEDLVRGAIASQQQVGKVGADVTDVVAAFYGRIKDPLVYAERAREVLDLLAVGATSANHVWGEQTLAMQYATPVARALGMTLEQTVAALGVLADNGFKGEKGGSALRTMLLRLVAPTRQARAAFRELGLEMHEAVRIDEEKLYDPEYFARSFAEKIGPVTPEIRKVIADTFGDASIDGPGELREALILRLKDALGIADGDTEAMSALIQQVTGHMLSTSSALDLDYVFGKLESMSAAQSRAIFGVRRTPQGIALARGFADQYLPKLLKVTEESVGATQRRMDIYLSGFAADVDRVTSALDSFAATLGQSGVLRDLSLFLETLRDGILALKQANPQLLRFATHATLALGLLAPLGFALGGVAAGVIALGRGLALARVGLLTFTLAGAPFLATVAAIAAAGKFIYDNWSGLVAFFGGVGEGFTEALGPAGPMLSGLLETLGALDFSLGASEETWRSWGRTMGAVLAAPFRLIRQLIDAVQWLHEQLRGLADLAPSLPSIGGEGVGGSAARAALRGLLGPVAGRMLPAPSGAPSGRPDLIGDAVSLRPSVEPRLGPPPPPAPPPSAASGAETMASDAFAMALAKRGLALREPVRDVKVDVHISGDVVDPERVGAEAGRATRAAVDEMYAD